MQRQLEKRVNLYLIGFMGVGKSAVGRGVARQLGYRFLDTDLCIQKKQACTISEIFETKGEKAFREMERNFIESGHDDESCIVSTGGGLIMEKGMRELLLSKGVVVCLFANPETIYERTSKTNKRPLLQVEDPLTQIKTMLDARLPIYQKTGIGICTENRSLNEIVSHVTRSYYSEARRFLRNQKKSILNESIRATG